MKSRFGREKRSKIELKLKGFESIYSILLSIYSFLFMIMIMDGGRM